MGSPLEATMSSPNSPVPGEHPWVSPFLQPLPGKVIQDQVVNYFVVVTGKLIQYRVVKKFIDVYKQSTKK